MAKKWKAVAALNKLVRQDKGIPEPEEPYEWERSNPPEQPDYTHPGAFARLREAFPDAEIRIHYNRVRSRKGFDHRVVATQGRLKWWGPNQPSYCEGGYGPSPTGGEVIISLGPIKTNDTDVWLKAEARCSDNERFVKRWGRDLAAYRIYEQTARLWGVPIKAEEYTSGK